MGVAGTDSQGKEEDVVNTLLELSLRGSMVAGVVWLLDRVLAGKMAARGRRWWWALVPVAFLVSIPLPVLPTSSPVSSAGYAQVIRSMLEIPAASHAAFSDFKAADFLFGLWIAGAVIYLLVVAVQTRTAVTRWSRIRLSTDPALLELLEDCKARAGVTAPIGLVVSDRVSAPAIMGWLRPRILLPQNATASLAPAQLRAVLLHELAHFRQLDVPLNWLFTLARAIHWFNPMAHLVARAWTGFREEAADETALRTMNESSGRAYGEALLAALRQAHDSSAPFGALAIGESIYHLKRRLVMINHYPNRSSRPLAAILILIVLATGVVLRPVRADEADPKKAAVAAMQTWLQEMDHGQYGQSWKDASSEFQKAVSSDQWVATSNAIRAQMGKCSDRKLASALEQTDVPSPTGIQHGDFVVAQFDSSFDNLKYAVETVCFEKAPDGTWKAAGYYIKPKT
jgi:beta-lactamase regulating signal transducer with metallopeptidase domain